MKYIIDNQTFEAAYKYVRAFEPTGYKAFSDKDEFMRWVEASIRNMIEYDGDWCDSGGVLIRLEEEDDDIIAYFYVDPCRWSKWKEEKDADPFPISLTKKEVNFIYA